MLQGAALALHLGLAAVAAATAAETVGAAAAAAKEAAAADTRDRLRMLELELETSARSRDTQSLASWLEELCAWPEREQGVVAWGGLVGQCRCQAFMETITPKDKTEFANSAINFDP